MSLIEIQVLREKQLTEDWYLVALDANLDRVLCTNLKEYWSGSLSKAYPNKLGWEDNRAALVGSQNKVFTVNTSATKLVFTCKVPLEGNPASGMQKLFDIELISESSSEILKTMLSESARYGKSVMSQLVAKEEALGEANKRMNTLFQKLEEAERIKTSIEEDKERQFLPILNAKKAKIEELKKLLQSKYDGSVPDSTL